MTGLTRHKGLARGGPLRPMSAKKLAALGGFALSTFAPKLARTPRMQSGTSGVEESTGRDGGGRGGVEGVLQLIVEEYYEGCKRYAAAPQPDSPERVFWRIRLGALSKYGSLLAAALGQAEPDWEAMREIAEQAVISDG